MSLRPESLEKKKNLLSSSFSYIPHEITENCLARISRSHYTRLSLVSKTFASLLSSKELYATRSHLGNTENCLYLCLCDRKSQFSQWFTLWINHNQTLPKSFETRKIGKLLVPVTSPKVSSITDYTSTVAVVGSEIYVIGGQVNGAPSSSVRILDCRFHTWRHSPNMNVARNCPVSCVYDGKIYVVGGCQGLDAEVFDTKTLTWERLPNPCIEIPEPFFFKIRDIKGKICVLRITSMYAYDPKQDKWDCSETNDLAPPDFKCVIDNVLYHCFNDADSGKCTFWWYDAKDEYWKEVKGIDLVSHMRNGEKLVSFGEKLLVIKEETMNDMKNIWCAEIMLEKRDDGEVWGNVEWDDVVQTVPRFCRLAHCLTVSL